MDYKKLALLLLFSAVILAGCLDWLNPPVKDEYEIFSNLPTDNAKALVYMKFTQDGTKEFQELFGKILTGDVAKKSQGSEAAIVLYNDSLGMVSYSKTNMSVNDAISEMNSSMTESQRKQITIETKNIGGKDVTILDVKSSGYDVPICIWKEGDTMKVLMMFNSPQTIPAPAPAFANEPASPLIGYALQVASEGQGSPGSSCDAILGKKYDTGNAKALFKDADYIKSSIPVSGKLFGEFKAYAGDNPLLNGSIYGVMFGDDNADNLVVAGRMNFTNATMANISNNYCASSATSSSKSSIIQSNGKEACMQEGKATLLTIDAQFITLQRKVGEYYIFVATYVKDNKNAVEESAKNTVFSVNLPGSDASWTDKAKLEVDVYSGGYGSRQPLGGVRVDLFKSIPSDYRTYDTSAPSELLETKYTDDSGKAVFENLPLNESLHLVASKEGYENQTQNIYSFTTPTTVYMTKVDKSLRVSVYEYSTGYGGGVKVKEARVSVYSDNELLGMNYTGTNGEAAIQNIENGKIRIDVSKEGYEYEVKSLEVGRYSRDTSIYLTRISNRTALANGTMSGAQHLCAQVEVSSSPYKLRAKFTSLNDTYSRYLMYGIDCPNADEIGYGCSTRGCSSGGSYCYIATASSSYANSGIWINASTGTHTICIWPSSPSGYNWFGQMYKEG